MRTGYSAQCAEYPDHRSPNHLTKEGPGLLRPGPSFECTPERTGYSLLRIESLGVFASRNSWRSPSGDNLTKQGPGHYLDLILLSRVRPMRTGYSLLRIESLGVFALRNSRRLPLAEPPHERRPRSSPTWAFFLVYLSVDDFGTLSWPSRVEIESLLVGSQ